MKEAIKKLIEKWACKHKWTLLLHIYASHYTYSCEHCGKIRKINV